MISSAITDEIQALCGRTGDTVLITDARCARWQNEAQRIIAEDVPGLHELSFKNTISFDTTATLSWPLAEITSGLLDVTTENRVAHVFSVWYLNGNESRKLRYIPIDEFDEKYPDPTHTDIPATICNIWTRRGNNIEIMPICLTENQDKDLRFDIGVYPIDITDALSSSLNDADEGLIAYGVWQAFVAMGSERATDAAIWRASFFAWLEKYISQNDTMPEWGGNWYED